MLNFLGIYEGDLESASSECEDALKGIGCTIGEIDDMYDRFADSIRYQNFNWDDPTNFLIDELFREAERLVERKGYKCSYCVNGYASSFSVEEDDE